ncbi:hypothetical protein LTR37_004599 [Vermiconidia calcicola]|uniref:Uncharacterized protein n=1 Tax=Vermiconidia calcicola TaxID=1690605 RepID=A0ACC3NMP2_9PEZI|nr:hypothetical protein LTR37_004599 [Vermiconidia calcicola]
MSGIGTQGNAQPSAGDVADAAPQHQEGIDYIKSNTAQPEGAAMSSGGVSASESNPAPNEPEQQSGMVGTVKSYLSGLSLGGGSKTEGQAVGSGAGEEKGATEGSSLWAPVTSIATNATVNTGENEGGVAPMNSADGARDTAGQSQTMTDSRKVPDPMTQESVPSYAGSSGNAGISDPSTDSSHPSWVPAHGGAPDPSTDESQPSYIGKEEVSNPQVDDSMPSSSVGGNQGTSDPSTDASVPGTGQGDAEPGRAAPLESQATSNKDTANVPAPIEDERKKSPGTSGNKENKDSIPTAGGQRLGEKHWGESDTVPDVPEKRASQGGNVSSSEGQSDRRTQDNTAANTGQASGDATAPAPANANANVSHQGEDKPSMMDKIKDKMGSK